MMNLNRNRFLASTKGSNEPMTIDAVRSAAPSAFATDKHESRSHRYTYIPTAAVIEAMMKEGYQPFAAIQGKSRIEGKEEFTKHLIRFRHPSAAMEVAGSIPEIVLLNSHDGTSAYKLFAGIFRIVCTNGLIVCDSTVGSISVPHKGNIVEEVVMKSFEIIDQTKLTTSRIDTWSHLQLTAPEQAALASSAHTLRFADAAGEINTHVKPQQLLNVRRREDQQDDLWTVFNRIQENALRGGIEGTATDRNGRTRQRSTREVKGIDENVRLNRALWQLTESMAQIKQQQQGVAA